jgi:hypothetical protein
MKIEKYSIGIGDRFGLEGSAQLRALQKAEALGVKIVPVWNKSNREHTIIGTLPEDAKREADLAVKICVWNASYYIDADHISLSTVDKFINSSNFFTIDIADYIGKPADDNSVITFLKEMDRFRGNLQIPGIENKFAVTTDILLEITRKYLFSIKEAGRVYRHIAEKKGIDNFITEISLDETNLPQSPVELFFILAAIAREKIPIQTIAPKFTGAFLKGVDYVGDISKFTREFDEDLAVVAHSIKIFNLPDNLKLSIHSGSDKFSLYPIIHKLLNKLDAGIHLKTAGTTWLEEVIGLASSGGNGLTLAKDIYLEALKRYDEMSQPYLTVIDIDKKMLPSPEEVMSWSDVEYVQALRHDQSCKQFNRHFRQLIHIGYKVASEMGEEYLQLLREYRGSVELNVTTNIFERHIQPLFLGQDKHGSKLTV